MIVLAADTATAACSTALWCDGKVRARESVAMPRGHAEALMPMIARTVAAAGTKLRDIDLVAVTVGPGSFTGLRAGLAAARGLAMALARPCAGVTTLEAIAAAVATNSRRHEPLLVALDSKRGQLFVQMFDACGTASDDPGVCAPDELRERVPQDPVAIVGDAAEIAAMALTRAGVRAHAVNAPPQPDPGLVAMIAARRRDTGDLPPVPLYLRSPDAKRPRFGGRQRP